MSRHEISSTHPSKGIHLDRCFCLYCYCIPPTIPHSHLAPLKRNTVSLSKPIPLEYALSAFATDIHYDHPRYNVLKTFFPLYCNKSPRGKERIKIDRIEDVRRRRKRRWKKFGRSTFRWMKGLKVEWYMIEKVNIVHSAAGATERTGEGRWGPRDLGTERNGPRSRLCLSLSFSLPPPLPTVLSRHQSRRAKERMVFIEWRTEWGTSLEFGRSIPRDCAPKETGESRGFHGPRKKEESREGWEKRKRKREREIGRRRRIGFDGNRMFLN